MGYNKENYRRIRAEYETKSLRAQEAAQARRDELYGVIPTLRELDHRLSAFGLRIMQAALNSQNIEQDITALRRENQQICNERAELLARHGYPQDYCEPHYDCDQCRDTGYVGIKMCACMRMRLIEAGMASSGLSGLMQKQSFENFSLDYYRENADVFKKMSLVLNTVRDYAQNFVIEEGKPMPKSLLFMGGTGLGKTHLSTALARKLIERGYDVFYNSAVGMISDFEYRRFGNGLVSGEGDDTARYTACDLLILDDLGTEVVNQFTLSCLYHVLNTRLNLGKPTVVSTNLTMPELRKSYSDRITSRLVGEFILLPFMGTDIRKQKILR